MRPKNSLSSYATEWRRKEVATTQTEAEVTDQINWLVFADRAGIGERVAQILRASGQNCVVLHRHFELLGSQPSSADSTTNDVYLRGALSAAMSNSANVRILYLWATDLQFSDPVSEELASSFPYLSCGAIVDLVKGLTIDLFPETTGLILVTAGSQAVRGEKSVQVLQAPVWGLGKVIAFEHPELACLRVDLDPKCLQDAPDLAAQHLICEINSRDGEDQVAYRSGVRYVPRLTQWPLARLKDEDAAIHFDPDANYLITGGLGFIGVRLIRWMADRGARRLSIFSRLRPTENVGKILRELRASNCKIDWYSADVTRPEQFEDIIRILRGSPRLAGVFHLAGTFNDGDLITLQQEILLSVMAGRALGAWYLHALTRDIRLDFFVLFSSTASIVGAPGQGVFAASNAFLDALSHHRQMSGLPATCINWGPWGDLASQDEMVPTIDPADGFTILQSAMASPFSERCVLPRSIDVLLKFFPRAASIPMFRELYGDGVANRLNYERGELSSPFMPPRDRTERLIARIVERALSLDRIGINDDFFELGGDSIMAAAILERINRVFDVDITFEDIVDVFTIDRLASVIRSQQGFTSEDSKSEPSNASRC